MKKKRRSYVYFEIVPGPYGGLSLKGKLTIYGISEELDGVDDQITAGQMGLTEDMFHS